MFTLRLVPFGARNRTRRFTMETTLASHNLQRRPRSRQTVFLALIARMIAFGIYGVVNNNSNTVDRVGAASAGAESTGIDPALVHALASYYPPVDQAAGYRAAARSN